MIRVACGFGALALRLQAYLRGLNRQVTSLHAQGVPADQAAGRVDSAHTSGAPATGPRTSIPEPCSGCSSCCR